MVPHVPAGLGGRGWWELSASLQSGAVKLSAGGEFRILKVILLTKMGQPCTSAQASCSDLTVAAFRLESPRWPCMSSNNCNEHFAPGKSTGLGQLVCGSHAWFFPGNSGLPSLEIFLLGQHVGRFWNVNSKKLWWQWRVLSMLQGHFEAPWSDSVWEKLNSPLYNIIIIIVLQINVVA